MECYTKNIQVVNAVNREEIEAANLSVIVSRTKLSGRSCLQV